MDKEEEAAFVPRPSHHPVFDRLQYTKTEGKGLVHVNVVSVYLGRQMGDGSPIKRTSLRPYLVVSAPSAGVFKHSQSKKHTTTGSK